MLLALLALRFSVLERVTGLVFVTAPAVGSFVVLATALAVAWIGPSSELLIVVLLAIVVAATATLRPIFAAVSESRARARYLVTLGRFSAQMAHDLKNPLAAIRGAAQVPRRGEGARRLDRRARGVRGADPRAVRPAGAGW